MTGLYAYTSDLLCLDFHRRTGSPRLPDLGVVRTPLNVSAWADTLNSHPDRAFARYVCCGLRYGFRIGCETAIRLKSALANMGSATAHPEVVSAYIAKELSLGRMTGPLDHVSGHEGLHISCFGVIPKGHNTGKWRLITDLSHPAGHSVNDGIHPDLCSLRYSTVDDIAGIVAQLGCGALLAKVDIESAYRLIPVHPDDCPLLAVRWRDQTYVDLMLPFGLRSAPKIFNAVADALNWYLHKQGIPVIRHYLDDFIIISPPHTTQCRKSLEILDRVCCSLGVPIADHKRDGPTTCLTFLGIEVDTLAGQLRLPADKRQRVRALLRQWGARRTCTRKELESLIGLLLPPAHLPRVHITSDASGSWGCGAWHGSAWFQLQWDHRSQPLTIAEKELIPIILGCVAWGRAWGSHGGVPL